MAHFAQLNEENIVTQVIVVSNDDIVDENGAESEEIGATFCLQFGSGPWVQTSYNSNFRRRFAGIGYFYDEENDRFIPPKPFASWVLNEETCQWAAPTPYPNDGVMYLWSEDTLTWVQA